MAQRGLITAAQLALLGVPRASIGYRNGLGGMFSRVLPGIHAVGTSQLDIDQRDQAALLYAGKDAALTGRSALLRYGVRAASRPEFSGEDRIHVLVPATRQRASHGFVSVERTHVPAAVAHLGGFAVVPVARAVLDASRRCRYERAVRALVAEVIQRSMTTTDDLRTELNRGARRGSAFPRRAIEEVTAGIRSAPEGDLRRGFVLRGLTEPLWNPELYLPNGQFLCRPDAYFAASGVAVEVDSREYHLSPEDWEYTMRRHARMTAAGLIVLHYPPSRIRVDIAGVVDEILRTVKQSTGRRVPELLITPADRS